MNLLLYWGNSIWGINVISTVFLCMSAIMTIILLILAFADGRRKDYINLILWIIYIIIIWVSGFPIKNIIVGLFFMDIVFCAAFISRGTILKILGLALVIGDIIGIVLFFKNVL